MSPQIDSSAEFERPQLSFEREFGQYRNWWARDKRIVGNAFSLLLYLLSHDRGFRITQRKAQADLGLGKDAFLVARRKLENAGYLVVKETRFPAGAVDRSGRPIGGHRQILFAVQDPEQPSSTASEDYPPTPASPTESRKASAENPSPEIPPLKKTDLKEEQSSQAEKPRRRARSHSTDDETGLRAIENPLPAGRGIDVIKLHRRLEGFLDDPMKEGDLQAAAELILSRAPHPVSDPTAYVFSAISRAPHQFALTFRSTAPDQTLHPSGRRPLTVAECGAQGHLAVSGCCIRCGITHLERGRSDEAAQ